MVPASGSTVSRATAVASLTRGKLENALLGGKPKGKPLITLGGPPAPVTIYVALPPPASITTSIGIRSRSSVAVIAVCSCRARPTFRARVDRRRGPDRAFARARREADPDLAFGPKRSGRARADERAPDAAHFARKRSTRVLIGLVFGFAALAWLLRSPLFGRASLIAIPAMVLASTIASRSTSSMGSPGGAGRSRSPLTVPLALVTRDPRALAAALAGLLAAYAVFLGVSPSTVSLAALGPHPEAAGVSSGSPTRSRRCSSGPRSRSARSSNCRC
jgi:hypothetical protein